MEHKEFATYFNFCNNELQIKIYPITTTSFGRVKIVVNKKGIESVGETFYSQAPKLNEPKYWCIINELYKQYFNLNKINYEH